MTYMQQALSLAKRAVGSVNPNPAVGAVLVKDGVVVGEGWTQPPGHAHAEIAALREAGTRAAGATLYTTLEPCNRFGRTPPCTEAIIEAGISEVHVALVDPNPLVHGGGLSCLEQSGVEIHVGEGGDEARELIEAYTKFITTGLPFVTAKFAMSLDGKIATRTGDSRWITGEEARRWVHQLRSASDAIMVGINTVVADNPRLTARDDEGNSLERQPLRIIVDSKGRIPRESKLLDEPGETLVAAATADDETLRSLEQAGAEVESIPAEDGSVDLASLFRELGCRSITSVLVEGGSTLQGSLFDRRLVDKVVAFIAPTIVGGKPALSPVAGEGAETMADVMSLHGVRVVQLGKDLAVSGYCRAESHVFRNC